MKPETKFRVNHVLPFLQKLRNCAIFPIQQVAIIGDLDYHLCINGWFVALEIKAWEPQASRKLTKTESLQNFNLGEVKRAHGVALKAYPENWEQVKKILTALDRGERHDQDHVPPAG